MPRPRGPRAMERGRDGKTQHGRGGIKKGQPVLAVPRNIVQTRRYFLAASTLAAASAYFLVKRSTRPAVSISFCLPVKKGWQLEQISTFMRSPLMVERVWKLLPQAQCTVME